MRSALLAFSLTVVACVVLLAACFNKGQSTTIYDGGLPDVVLSGVNLPDAGTGRYTVGGNVNGLVGTGLVLAATGTDFGVQAGEDISVPPVAGSGAVSFHFPTAVPTGVRYSVVVKTQPTNPAQNCKVVGGNGTVPRANVTDVAVNCSTTTFVIGGTATGLESKVLLYDNGGDPLSVANDGTFAFLKPLPSGSKYAVTVGASPVFPSETCRVTQGTGTVTNSKTKKIE